MLPFIVRPPIACLSIHFHNHLHNHLSQRNNYPAAQSKDRHSRTGLTKSEFERKGGAGPHNWGSFTEEENLAYQGGVDAQLETAMFDDSTDVAKPSAEATADADEEADNVSTSPANSMSSLGGPGQRRMSQVSDEERANALRYREGGVQQKGIDLASIARTSYGVAQSPPAASMLSTSPLRTKAGFSAVSWATA